MEKNSDNFIEGLPESSENIEVKYDGSDIISSIPFEKYDELEKIEDFDLKRDEDINKNIDKQNNESEKKEPDIKNHIERLMMHNTELLKRVSDYQKAFIEMMTKKAEPVVKEPEKTVDQIDEKLNKMYQKAKEDSVRESVKLIEEQINYKKRLQQFADENPDIAEDKFSEFVVSTLAGRYIESGGEFEDSVRRAIADFRKLTGTENKPLKTKEAKAKAAHIEGSSQPSEEPVYTSQDLLEMQLYRPDEYIRLQPTIIRAYKDGRVK